MRFKKKPVVIEAWPVKTLCAQAQRSTELLPPVIRASVDQRQLEFLGDLIVVNTLEGRMRADWDDWLIRGVQGEFYPCKPDIFLATYEPALHEDR